MWQSEIVALRARLDWAPNADGFGEQLDVNRLGSAAIDDGPVIAEYPEVERNASVQPTGEADDVRE